MCFTTGTLATGDRGYGHTMCHSGFLINYWFMFALAALGLSPYSATLGSGLEFLHRYGTVLRAVSCGEAGELCEVGIRNFRSLQGIGAGVV